MADDILLNCSILGHDVWRTFRIRISPSGVVEDLKDAIQAKRATRLNPIDTADVDVWKLPNPLSSDEIVETLKDIVDGGDILNAVLLEPMEALSFHFPAPLAPNKLHLVIRAPTAGASPSVSRRNDRSEPHVLEVLSRRTHTVETLYNKLNKYRFMQVRGTPASGKSTLLNLLYLYIKKTNPKARIQIINRWPKPEEKQENIYQRLEQRVDGYPNTATLTYILFDNGQTTYWDEDLWEVFFKNTTSFSNNTFRVIIFCSYGSAGIRPLDYNDGAPLHLDPRARVSLVPNSEQEDEFGLIGLLYTREEFNEVLRLTYEHELGEDLQDLIFSWTNGHPGAVADVLRTVSTRARNANRSDTFLDLEGFFQAAAFSAFLEDLARPGGWTRGLPTLQDLKRPELVGVFRHLVQNRSIPHESPPSDPDLVNECHKNGWIFATTDQAGEDVYVLPSPLHHLYFEWKLLSSSNLLLFDSLWDLSIKAIERFKPSRLSNLSRRVGDAGVARPNEATYQDEFYRSLFSATHGCVCLSPEYSSAQGTQPDHVDFFIPSTKWGIKLLRDGNKLEEHGDHFLSRGAYGTWVTSSEIMDYIILDFRSAPPKKAHTHIPKLYHVVFRNDSFNHIVILNNKLEIVKESVLFEN